MTMPPAAMRIERVLVALLAMACGAVLAYLALLGPLGLGRIRYRTAALINHQLLGQDLVNLFLLAPLLVGGGLLLLRGRPAARYLLVSTPLYLVYYALSYTIGWEWSSSRYAGNSELYTFHFLFVLVAALVLLLYSLSLFPARAEPRFRRRGLAVYSALLVAFLLLFASMWIGEVRQVMATGTARAYDIAPTAFWLVRVFDLGFTIPLGLLSVYLLWSRPAETFALQWVFYGFFLTMIVAVNAMGVVMLVQRDPTFLWRDLVVFACLGLIVAGGFAYVLRGYRPPRAGGRPT